MSWKNRLMKKEKNKRNKQFGIKCKETNHLIELLGMLCLFGLMNLWEVVFPEDTIWNRAISILLGWRWAFIFFKSLFWVHPKMNERIEVQKLKNLEKGV